MNTRFETNSFPNRKEIIFANMKMYFPNFNLKFH